MRGFTVGGSSCPSDRKRVRRLARQEAIETAWGESLSQEITDESRSALDAYVREGARQMLQRALVCEVEAFLADHADRTDEQGQKHVVWNGYLQARSIMTSAGMLEIEQPRARDKTPRANERVAFTSAILPPYLRKSRSIEKLIPWLYLKGISTDDYAEALQALLGTDATGLSPNVIVRLKEKWGQEYEAACSCLSKALDVLLAFYDFPAEHWDHLRTTNPIESTFSTISRRHRRTKGRGSRKASLTMMFKLTQSASRRWRRLNGHHQIVLVLEGRIFTDGVLQNAA